MSRSSRLARAWAPVLLWMLAIFIGSTDLLSSHNTSRFIEPLLRWLNPGISEIAVQRIQFIIRKGGHMTEYAVLVLLIRRGLHLLSERPFWLWNSRSARWALLLAVLYATTDEFHQSFVASREASTVDVLIDSTGATLALMAVWLIIRAGLAGDFSSQPAAVEPAST